MVNQNIRNIISLISLVLLSFILSIILYCIDAEPMPHQVSVNKQHVRTSEILGIKH